MEWSHALTAFQVSQSGMTEQHMRLGRVVILRHVACREESRAMRMLRISDRLVPLVCRGPIGESDPSARSVSFLYPVPDLFRALHLAGDMLLQPAQDILYEGW